MYIKMNFKLVIIVLAVVTFAACNSGIGQSVSLKTPADSASYAIGIIIGEQNKRQIETFPGGKLLDREIILKAFNEHFIKGNSKMTFEETDAIVNRFVNGEIDREKNFNQAEAESFLTKNKTKKGVITLESGLQYEVLKEGTGAKPIAGQDVKCHYHGTFSDGTVFESSVDRGTPSQFNINGVIKGWTEALQLMPVGSKWRLYIPGNLGYGENGTGKIGPNKLLIFDLELLEIVEAQ